MKEERFDIHQHITNQIVAAIEGSSWNLPEIVR